MRRRKRLSGHPLRMVSVLSEAVSSINDAKIFYKKMDNIGKLMAKAGVDTENMQVCVCVLNISRTPGPILHNRDHFATKRYISWVSKARFPYRHKRRGRPSIDGDIRRSIGDIFKSWTDLSFSHLDWDVGDTKGTSATSPKKRSHIIVSVPVASLFNWLGRAPVTYDIIETRLYTLSIIGHWYQTIALSPDFEAEVHFTMPNYPNFRHKEPKPTTFIDTWSYIW